MPKPPHGHMGFTLVELSIVLVIVGLIIGGVLTGRDLIAAATIRSQVSQFEKYNSAVNTFRGKYGYLPGDITASAAAQFGFATRAGAAGQGDGNGLIEGGIAAGNQEAGENRLVWNDLSTATLIDGQYTGQDCAFPAGTCTVEATPQQVATLLPSAKIGRGNFIVIAPDAVSGNDFVPLIITATNSGGGATGSGATGLNYYGTTPQEAYTIDAKIDDGHPTTGRVISVFAPWSVFTGAPPAGTAATASAGNCGDSDTTPTSYNIGPVYANLLVCAIGVRLQ